MSCGANRSDAMSCGANNLHVLINICDADRVSALYAWHNVVWYKSEWRSVVWCKSEKIQNVLNVLVHLSCIYICDADWVSDLYVTQSRVVQIGGESRYAHAWKLPSLKWFLRRCVPEQTSQRIYDRRATSQQIYDRRASMMVGKEYTSSGANRRRKQVCTCLKTTSAEVVLEEMCSRANLKADLRLKKQHDSGKWVHSNYS